MVGLLLLAAVAVQMPSEAERNHLGIPAYEQNVVVKFASAEDAAKAQLQVMPLPGNAKLALTSRWDDSDGRHIPHAEVLNEVGVHPTFFLNGSKEFFKTGAPKLLALGCRLGNHTTSHPFLMESGINKMFNEVMKNKIDIEAGTDSTVTSFVIPFNWGCLLEPGRAAKLGKILVETGHIVSSDWPNDAIAQKPYDWMVGYTFKANDNNPNAGEFEKGLAGALADVDKNPNYPKITFGIHSWCKPEGYQVQKACLAKHVGNPDWWVTDDSRYGAYRYQFYHGKVAKGVVKGAAASFAIQRFEPAYLGAAEPLCVGFGDVTPVSVTVDGREIAKDSKGFYAIPHGADHTVAQVIDQMGEDGRSAKFPGVSVVLKVDEDKGELSYAFTNASGKDAKALGAVINPAPMWSKSRITTATATGTVSLGEKNTASDYQTGDRLYAVGIDFMYEGKRCRLYATHFVKGRKAAGGGDTPRDCLQVLGPIHTNRFVEADWIKLSSADATLPNLGAEVTEYWRSLADPDRVGFSAAAYIPWAPVQPQEFKDAVGKLCSAKADMTLGAVDFFCDADGEKDLLINRSKWEPVTYYVNGEKFTAKGHKHRIKVKKGRNRLIVRWYMMMPWTPQNLLVSVCDDGDVDKAVKFTKPIVAPRESVFTSKGISTEFSKLGHPREVFNGEDTLVCSFNFGCGASLPSKKGWVSVPKYERRDGCLVSTIDAPIGTKSDDYSLKYVYTISEKYVEIEGTLQAREGVEWKGVFAVTEIFFPVKSFCGKALELIDMKDKPFVREFGYDYQKTNDIANFKGVVVPGKFKLVLENCFVQQMFDRRQWRQQTANMKIVPTGAANYGAATADSRVFNWKVRIEAL